MKDPVISVKDLLATCVKKAKLLLVLAFVFAVALCGYKFVSDVSAQQKIEEAKKENEDLSTELSEEDLAQVQEYIETVELRDEIVDYNKNSIYMRGNPYNLFFIQIEYKVDAATLDSQRNAVIALRNYIYDGLPEDLSLLDESGLNAKYFREALICESTGYGSYLDSNIIRIKLFAATEEEASIYGQNIELAMEKHVTELNKSGIDGFAVEKIYEVVSSEYYGVIINEVYAQKNMLTEYKNRVETLEAGLSKQQLAEAFKIMKIEETVDVETEETVGDVSIDITFLVLGAVLGIVVGIVFVAVKYIFTNTVKTDSDIHELFGLLGFGHITCKTLSAWDKAVNKVFYPSQSFEIEDEKKLIASKVKMYCRKNNINNLAFVVSQRENEQSALTEIAGILKSSQIACDVIDRNDMDKLENVQYVVMTGEIGKTNYGTFETDLLFFKGQDVQVLGYITFI